MMITVQKVVALLALQVPLECLVLLAPQDLLAQMDNLDLMDMAQDLVNREHPDLLETQALPGSLEILALLVTPVLLELELKDYQVPKVHLALWVPLEILDNQALVRCPAHLVLKDQWGLLANQAIQDKMDNLVKMVVQVSLAQMPHIVLAPLVPAKVDTVVDELNHFNDTV